VKVAVIIAAHGLRPDWFDECLSSVQISAADVLNLDLDVRIGVDGCADTAAALDSIGLAYWWSPTNVGTYVIRNSLIALAPADAFVVFDSDDAMLPEYFPLVCHELRTYSLVGPGRVECTQTLKPVEQREYKHGVCAFRPDVLERLGGYQSERLAADVDFIARARLAGFTPHIIAEPCYLRRQHAASLTTAPVTRRGSAARRQATQRMERQRLGGKVYVAPVTTPLEYRGQEARTA
jgi:hypothetical protein